MRFSTSTFALVPWMAAGLALSGCAEPPFIDRGSEITIEKPVDTVLTSGMVTICHAASASMAEITALATEACARHGALAHLTQTDRWQCTIANPHRAQFACRIPGLVDERGKYINPADKKAVAEWKARTGKPVPGARAAIGRPAPDAVPAPTQVAPPPPADMPPPPPAALAPAPRPLTPADIAGKPPLAPAPLMPPQGAAPPPDAAPTTPGFNLPIGSWGDAFEE